MSDKFKDLDIKVTTDTGVKELVVRQGEAKKIYEPTRQNINGAISAPAAFMAVRGYKKETDHVIYSRAGAEPYISFIYNERLPEGGSISGALKQNPDLQSIFSLRNTETWTTRDLAQHLKRNRVFFRDKDENAKIVTLLNNFQASIQTEVEQSQDTRGNKKQLVDKTVKSNVPVEFTLEMPIYVGFDKKTFRVEICFDTTDSSVRCWMESAELQELTVLERDRIINEQLKPFQDAGLVIIEK